VGRGRGNTYIFTARESDGHCVRCYRGQRRTSPSAFAIIICIVGSSVALLYFWTNHAMRCVEPMLRLQGPHKGTRFQQSSTLLPTIFECANEITCDAWKLAPLNGSIKFKPRQPKQGMAHRMPMIH